MNDIPVDHRKVFAAVVSFHHESVYNYRFVVHAADAEDYVKQVAVAVRDAILPLIEHYYEHFVFGDLEGLKDLFEEELNSPDEVTLESLVDLVKRVPELAHTEYTTSGTVLARDSVWYQQLIDTVNYNLPDGVGVLIGPEGALPEFLPKFLEFVAVRIPRLSRISDSEAIWLGKLAALNHREWSEESIARENWLVFHALVAAFDERNSNL